MRGSITDPVGLYEDLALFPFCLFPPPLFHDVESTIFQNDLVVRRVVVLLRHGIGFRLGWFSAPLRVSSLRSVMAAGLETIFS